MLTFLPKKILVVGDLMLDQYWYGQASRISQEAPVPLVDLKQSEAFPGGAANVALNLACLGAEVYLQGIVGEDAEADTLASILQAKGVICQFIKAKYCRTITKLRVLSQNQQLVRLDQEQAFKDHCDQAIEDLEAAYQAQLDQVEAVILSDYNKGTLQTCQAFIALAKQKQIPIFIDPKQADFSKYRCATMVTPNLKEFEAMVGACETTDTITRKALEMIQQYDLQHLLITRGEAGASLISYTGEAYHIPTQVKTVFDVTGAGDTTLAVITLSLLCEYPLKQAVEIANAAGGIAVSKVGTATVSVAELNEALGLAKKKQKHGIVSEAELLAWVKHYRPYGEKIVFTNGCFDILHAGHVKYLEQAKKLGDRLIVAVNVDETVRQLKGSSRPVNSLTDRMALLATLRCVDWVVSFSELTPERLIQAVNPDLLVKGGDYNQPEALPGAKHVLSQGGSVRVLGLEKGCSTTDMIEKVLAQEKSS